MPIHYGGGAGRPLEKKLQEKTKVRLLEWTIEQMSASKADRLDKQSER